MKLLIKDDNGSVIMEKELNKEELVLELLMKDGVCAIGQREDSIQHIGAYH